VLLALAVLLQLEAAVTASSAVLADRFRRVFLPPVATATVTMCNSSAAVVQQQQQQIMPVYCYTLAREIAVLRLCTELCTDTLILL
jgi:hypothetical protein